MECLGRLHFQLYLPFEVLGDLFLVQITESFSNLPQPSDLLSHFQRRDGGQANSHRQFQRSNIPAAGDFGCVRQIPETLKLHRTKRKSLQRLEQNIIQLSLLGTRIPRHMDDSREPYCASHLKEKSSIPPCTRNGKENSTVKP